MNLPLAADVIAAYDRIKSHIHQTPVFTSKSINQIVGCELFFKCENLQKVGAFKYRGACNAVLSLTDAHKAKGVATHSSGNHAAALALAARENGAKAYIVMPENAPEIKKKAVAGYGAQITFCKPTLEARESTLEQVVRDTGATMVHPYNQWEVICGQGTAAMELLSQQGDLNTIITPVGGGGLLSGTATYVKERFPEVKVMAGEPKMADDAYRSFKAGKFLPVNNPNTIADGLRTSLGTLTFEIIKNKVDDILVVDEESIRIAMRMVWERMKIIIEPSSAVPLAAILENREVFANQKVGLIISGGNVDLENLPF
ncbi:pyridoxal-phosphate dependent enzyme [Carboxylicivirga mesophila]|uniref:Pyridoxal-phosphate dependent enzyme n=1 Tax=Carboxylicivirga mesophila TaxID=1166478 RepID=A0ABS5KAZ0_9BACT|nr:pyridoxal-phosphate dependent enzyme [Carboxylicivirga mesophila]MBS2211673.1 pyridoxal-phosphate dependent enzyme [Carboxylicivirga mesophila]